jgi:hypothetical protein
LTAAIERPDSHQTCLRPNTHQSVGNQLVRSSRPRAVAWRWPTFNEALLGH